MKKSRLPVHRAGGGANFSAQAQRNNAPTTYANGLKKYPANSFLANDKVFMCPVSGEMVDWLTG